MSVLPNKPTTPFTPAVLAVAHPEWCAVAECRPTPDWGHDGLGLLVHHLTLLDADGLLVEVARAETISARGEVLDPEPIVVLVQVGGLPQRSPAPLPWRVPDERRRAPRDGLRRAGRRPRPRADHGGRPHLPRHAERHDSMVALLQAVAAAVAGGAW